MKDLGRLFKYLKNYKLYAILGPVFIIFAVMMELLVPKIMADIINIGVGGGDLVYIILNIIIMVSLSIIGIVGSVLSVYFSTKVSESVSADIRKDMFAKITSLSFYDFNKLKTGSLMTILTNDIGIVGNIFTMILQFLIRVPIIMVGSIIMAISISLKLSIVILIVLPFIFVLAVIAIKKGLPYFSKMQESIDNVNNSVRDNVGGIKVVKAFAMEDYEIRKFEAVNKNARNIITRAYSLMVMFMPIMMFFINMATILVLLFGSELVKSGSLEVGSILAFIQYLTNILMSLAMASMAFAFLIRSFASAKRINEVFAYQNNIIEHDNAISKTKINGDIEFKDVSFSYQDGQGDLVLKNLNFKISAGEKVAILGSTGSGKTTIAALLCRFYDAISGEILIDNENIQNYKISSLRKNIGYVFQTPTLFSGTIKSNLVYGASKVKEEDIVNAAKIAQAHEFIMRKDKKYDDEVEQLAHNLSGGQKQRLALARTLLLNPKIMVLDDTTSALDAKTEKKLRKSLYESLKDKTIITITQRISTAMDTDKIIILEDGEINGIGNHEELLKTNAIYKCIYDSQVKGGE